MSRPVPDPEIPDGTPVEEEERLLQVVLRTLRAPRARRAVDYDAELMRLREELADERMPEDEASILEQMSRVAYLREQRARYDEGRVDISSPYFGHMRLLDEDGGRRDVLIGNQTFVRGGVRIVDWRNAPISRLFYQVTEGEDFEIEIAGKMVAGEMVVRRTLAIERGELVRVGTPDTAFVKLDGAWVDMAGRGPDLAGGAGTAARPDLMQRVLGVAGATGDRAVRSDKFLPAIAALLDAEQFDLITRPNSGLVAIQGSAGSGKTTVALHRVAYLAFQDAKRFASDRILVVVVSPALRRYISKVLPALGVDNVGVRTYEDWAARLRREHFPRLVTEVATDTPGVVTRFKLHSALLPMLDEAAMAHDGEDVVDVFDELFTSRPWIADGLERWAPGEFTAGEVDAIHRWCADQYFVRAEGGGARDHEVPSYDAEDDTILLRLHQLLVGPLKRKGRAPLRYSHLVVDEVQDLAAIELLVLMGTVSRKAPVTLAGDVAQRVSDEGGFSDWSDVLDHLGLGHVALSPLRVSYRSTQEIMDAAQAVLGPLRPDEPPTTPRRGAPVEGFQFGDRGAAFAFVTDALRHVSDHEPSASVAVMCRTPGQAAAAHQALARADLPTLRHVADNDFSFAPGIEVTDVRQAKGLEFDYVVLMDCDRATWPPTDDSRHLLHVGMTRAAHQLWLVTVGPPTRLLPEGLVRRA